MTITDIKPERPLVEDFAALFAGCEDAYGTGRGEAIRRRLSLVQYGMHLGGIGHGLGVYPMLPDNTVWFGAIDIDEPDFELGRELQGLLPAPTWVERSRSGNAHVWVFFERPAAAWAVRGRLMAALEAAGKPKIEVFPKQDELREGMLGNYINLPYHGDERPVLHGQSLPPTANNLPLLPGEFIAGALRQRHDPDRWEREARALGCQPPSERADRAQFGEQAQLHRCAEYIYENRESNPVQSGHRHSVYLALSKQLANWGAISLETALRMLHEVNEAAVEPAPGPDVDRIFDTVVSAGYTSTGCDDPLLADYIHPNCPIAHG